MKKIILLFTSILVFINFTNKPASQGDEIESVNRNIGLLSLEGDPFTSLARYYLEEVTGAYLQPAARRVENLLQAATRAQVDGVIVCTTKYCDPYSFELPYLEKAFQDKGFPVLLLETSLSMPSAQVKNRVEAFFEILKA